MVQPSHIGITVAMLGLSLFMTVLLADVAPDIPMMGISIPLALVFGGMSIFVTAGIK